MCLWHRVVLVGRLVGLVERLVGSLLRLLVDGFFRVQFRELRCNQPLRAVPSNDALLLGHDACGAALMWSSGGSSLFVSAFLNCFGCLLWRVRFALSTTLRCHWMGAALQQEPADAQGQ